MKIKSPWRIIALAAAIGVGVLLIALASIVPFSSDTARRKVVEVLADRLDAEVELAELQIRVLPQFRAEGRGLSIRHKGRTDVPPMISLKSFSAEGNLAGLLRRHIARVEVAGLDIQIPPDDDDDESPKTDSRPASSTDEESLERTFVIDELVSTDARLVIIPDEAGKRPKVWDIHRLQMEDVSLAGPMTFAATLRNAVPPGDIETSGSFGPWTSDEPGDTPLDGRFTFARADLGVFKGISGILSAHGTFGGVLERIDINGETETPDFTVEAGGNPIALHTAYRATVDGTNGNTLLDQIDASFLQTSLVAKGSVINTPGVEGRTVTLDVTMDKARLEDVLRLAIKGPQPPMVGALKLETTLVIPPGDRDVVEKLQLDGTFEIGGTRFTNAEVQTKINELSRRTRGQMADTPKAERVSSQFAGAFKLANGRLALPHVTFDVPGSAIRLSGSYGLVSEQIDFAGTAYTDAKISQMTTGIKSFLLKPVDLLFRNKQGGAEIPIRITGTRNEPSFGLDKGRVFRR